VRRGLVTFATTRADDRVDFDLAAAFRFETAFGAVFFAAPPPARLLAPRALDRRAGFAAFRTAFRTGFRPLERATVRELFRAAFLVPPAALRLAITCSLFGDRFQRSVRPEISARLP
jgi:hypothetical protein